MKNWLDNIGDTASSYMKNFHTLESGGFVHDVHNASVKDKIVPSEALKTFDFGSLEGEKQTDELNKAIHHNIINNPDGPMAKEGESFNQATSRVIPKMDEILKTAPANTAIVTHNSIYGLIKLWEKENRPSNFDKNQREAYTKQDNKFDTGEHFTIQGTNGPIHIVRHGETKDNVNKNFRRPDTPLTSKGIQQAKTLGKMLGEHDIPQVITSPLPRTLQTSGLILKSQPSHEKKNARSGAWLDNYGEEENANEGTSTGPAGAPFSGTTNKGFDYNGAWGGQFANGGSLPGSVGFTYARTKGIPSNGPGGKKTVPSAQGGFSTRQRRGIELQMKEHQNALKDEAELHRTGTIKNPRSISYQQKSPKREEVRPNELQGAVSKGWEIASNPLTAAGYKVRGEDIPDYFSRNKEGRVALDAATDIINPAFYANEAGSTIKSLATGHPLDAAGHALNVLPLAAEYSAMKNFNPINRELAAIEQRGAAEGLNEYQIAQEQMRQVGITSNQRKGYMPGISDLVEKYITPFGYVGDSGQSKLQQTLQNIREGGWKNQFGNQQGMSPGLDFKERMDAWNMYLGKPQEYGTFKLADTAPTSHRSYPAGSLEGMDIYNIQSPETHSNILPDIPESLASGHLRRKNYLDRLEKDITYHRDPTIMGGYNARLSDEGLQYNDIWDLNPRVELRDLVPKKYRYDPRLDKLFYSNLKRGGMDPRGVTVPVDKILGKPFMAHGNLPYTSGDYRSQLLESVKRGKENVISSHIDTPEDVRKALGVDEKLKGFDDYIEKINTAGSQSQSAGSQPQRTGVFPGMQDGGVVKDNLGYWNPDNWGRPVEIDGTDITMQGVNQPLLGVSDTGDKKLMKPGKNYKFKGNKVTELPVGKNGGNLRQEQKGKVNLDQLTNWTNYNTPQKGGWLDNL